jgi:hypothetical protein
VLSLRPPKPESDLIPRLKGPRLDGLIDHLWKERLPYEIADAGEMTC